MEAGLTLFEISKIFYKLDPEGPTSVLENMVKKAEEVASVVKTSVCRNLYSELNIIHQKNAEKDSLLTRSAVVKKAASGTSPEKHQMVDSFHEFVGEEDSPVGRGKTVFHLNSELSISGVFSNKMARDYPEIKSAARKRAQSCMEGDQEISGLDSYSIRLEPVSIDSGDKPMTEQYSFKKVESETRDETPPKGPSKSKTKCFPSPKSVRRTISDPQLAKVNNETRKTVEDSSNRVKPRQAEGSPLLRQMLTRCSSTTSKTS